MNWDSPENPFRSTWKKVQKRYTKSNIGGIEFEILVLGNVIRKYGNVHPDDPYAIYHTTDEIINLIERRNKLKRELARLKRNQHPGNSFSYNYDKHNYEY